MTKWFRIATTVLLGAAAFQSAAAQDRLTQEASDALRRAVHFFHHDVASHGGYVYRYSADLSKREGEGKTGTDTVWVQPPGTPSVGMAYIEAYERTGEKYLLDAALAAGECLIQGQLRSGGWTNNIEFAPEQRARIAYRVDTTKKKRPRNVSTFDDDKTQAAMRMLIRLDRVLNFRNKEVHEASLLALDSVLKNQFPNGAWAQGFETPPDPASYPVKRAEYPASWPREYPGGDYWWFYTFNDNAISDTVEMLFLAAEVYGEPRYRQAALRAGDFIVLAQMPDPQPAWAQQYNFDMHPAWARKFEPASISGLESQGLLRTLMKIYVETGEAKYLEPIPRALAYLQASRLPDGRLARFYELKTNKPLYMTRNYELTYDDQDLPTHYGFQVSSSLDSLAQEFERLSRITPEQLAKMREERRARSNRKPGEKEVRGVIAALDSRGAWVEDGRLRYHGKGDNTRQVIECSTFIRNVGILSRYLDKSAK